MTLFTVQLLGSSLFKSCNRLFVDAQLSKDGPWSQVCLWNKELLHSGCPPGCQSDSLNPRASRSKTAPYGMGQGWHQSKLLACQNSAQMQPRRQAKELCTLPYTQRCYTQLTGQQGQATMPQCDPES